MKENYIKQHFTYSKRIVLYLPAMSFFTPDEPCV